MRTLLLALVASFSCSLHAFTVNRLNGGTTVVYIDFSVPGAVIPLELARTYNSITAASEQRGWLGAFGWGWTAPFETTLTTTPERNVLLRDGANGNTVLFRAEKEDPKMMTQFLEQLKKAYFEKEKGKKLTKEELSRKELPARIVKQLKKEPDFRLEMATKYGIESSIPNGQMLISSEFGYQTIHSSNKQWIRQRDGMTQVFDEDGRLIKQIDKNGFYFDYAYSRTQKYQIEQISDANKSLSLKFKWQGERVVEITDNKGNRASYSYDSNGNLIQATDSNRQTYRYVYNNKKFPHILTRIDYVSESRPDAPVYREIQYNENALVVFHREKDGVETTYTYGKIARDPENNFWTKSVKTAAGVREEIYDEYLIKTRPDGTKYLHRQENRQTGMTTVTVYTPCCGKPLEVTRNGAITSYKYYPNGLLKERIGPNEEVRIEYDPRWKKVSQVFQNGVTSKYAYDSRGNLVRASNSRNETVSLKYDKAGRILEMAASSGKPISFKYGDQGKPILITQAGVGTIKIDYDSAGRVRNAETIGGTSNGKGDPKEVGRKVMLAFQTLLDIIRPAGIDSNLG